MIKFRYVVFSGVFGVDAIYLRSLRAKPFLYCRIDGFAMKSKRYTAYAINGAKALKINLDDENRYKQKLDII